MKKITSLNMPIRWLLMAGALWMIGMGLYNAEADTVFAKAAQICLECIGIG